MANLKPIDGDDNHAVIVEVGLRDGLQAIKKILTPEQRAELILSLIEAGIHHIEVGSFVSPKKVPQLSDTGIVAELIGIQEGIITSALIPNERGLYEALQTSIDEYAVFIGATDEFTLGNIGKTVQQALETYQEIIKIAFARGKKVRGYLSCIVRCPYSGAVSSIQVARLVDKLLEIGCYEVSLGETLGVATPADIEKVLHNLGNISLTKHVALHLHNTFGQALANILRGLDLGIRRFDAGVGGFGGCPFAPGSAGNLATEDLVYLLNGLGIKTGININALPQITRKISTLTGESAHSLVSKALENQLSCKSVFP
jgi:hydroxymethylglutaryl-CoA lyase